MRTPDLTLDKAKIILNLTSPHKKVSLKCMRALFPTFPGFVEYADAIFRLEFQITPGSQLAGENLFKLHQTAYTESGNTQTLGGAKFHLLLLEHQ